MPDVKPDTPLYPLKLRPRFVPKMWGGRRLQSVLHKPLPPRERIGESWELYDFPPGVVEDSRQWTSVAVAEGALAGRTLHELMLSMPDRLLGKARPLSTAAGPQFPVLIKFLDAEQDLSLQVHPDERYAALHPRAHLKNEAWYVLAHRAEARLLKGLVPGVTRRQFEQALADGSVERLVRSIPARVGDVHYLPSGTLHALGGGILVAEVQTPSDTTFRVHDFGRIDPATGRRRELHVAEAMEIIDFDASGAEPGDGREGVTPPPRASESGILVRAPQFTLSKWSAAAGLRTPLAAGAASVLIITAGEGAIAGERFERVGFQAGDTLLIPADLSGSVIDPQVDCQWLEVTFPQ